MFHQNLKQLHVEQWQKRSSSSEMVPASLSIKEHVQSQENVEFLLALLTPGAPEGSVLCRSASPSVGKSPCCSAEHKRNEVQFASPYCCKRWWKHPAFIAYTNHTPLPCVYIWAYIYPYVCMVSATAVFDSFCWNTCISHVTLRPPSHPQNLWLGLFVFISPNCRGHMLSYPIVVILLLDGRVYVFCPNNRGGKKPFQAVSSDISVLCPLLSNHFYLPVILFVNPSGIMCYVNTMHTYMCAKSFPIFL